MNYKFILIAILLFGCNEKTIKSKNECPVISVKFSPNGGAEEAIVDSIKGSNSSINVLAYSFTATNIAEALVKAKDRGSKVSVVVDREALGNPHSVVKYLRANNVQVFVDGKHAIAHSKVIIIDKELVITGSYNFSNGANTKNSENSIQIADQKLADTYFSNWQEHMGHSTPYEDD